MTKPLRRFAVSYTLADGEALLDRLTDDFTEALEARGKLLRAFEARPDVSVEIWDTVLDRLVEDDACPNCGDYWPDIVGAPTECPQCGMTIERVATRAGKQGRLTNEA